MAEFQYTELLPLGEDKTTYRKISDSGFKIEKLGNKEFLVIEPETIKKLTFEAMHDCQHYLRTSHLKQLRKILDDKEASNNDKFVALDLLKKANDPRIISTVSLGGIFPLGETPIYTTSKFGLRGAILSLSLDLEKKGIKVSSI